MRDNKNSCPEVTNGMHPLVHQHHFTESCETWNEKNPFQAGLSESFKVDGLIAKVSGHESTDFRRQPATF